MGMLWQASSSLNPSRPDAKVVTTHPIRLEFSSDPAPLSGVWVGTENYTHAKPTSIVETRSVRYSHLVHVHRSSHSRARLCGRARWCVGLHRSRGSRVVSGLHRRTARLGNRSRRLRCVRLASSLRKFVSELDRNWRRSRWGQSPRSSRWPARSRFPARLVEDRSAIGNSPAGRSPRAVADLDLPESRRTRLEGRRPRTLAGWRGIVRGSGGGRGAVAGRSYYILHLRQSTPGTGQTTEYSQSEGGSL